MISKPFPAPYSNTYNTGWRNHPNFSWRNDHPTNSAHPGAGAPQYSVHTQQNALISAPRRPMYDPFQQMASTLQQFMQSQTTINNQTSQAINDIRNNLTKLNTTLSTQEKGKFLSQPQPNPQVQNATIESSSSSEANVRTCKVVITLRSGKEVETLGNEAGKKGESSISNAQGKNSDVDVSLEPKVTPPAPFPQRLVPLHKDKHHAEILDIFRQVRINIPLLNAIEQIPTYAKFLKDLCTVKRRLNVKKKAFLMEQVSAIIQSNTPPKYKDPDSPIIACVIGSSKIGQALLDLGSSVNLLPYNTYEQLGLGELKPTSIILQLADRSIKKPRAPVILGRPFLATSNALINCRSGILKLTFGNMTLELNVFNTFEQEEQLLRVLKQHKGALGWSIADIKGISPTICTHRIFLEENSSPTREMQRRLNPTMKEVVKNEVLKLLDVGIIYPISDSQWENAIWTL
ncbi:uncharacterized protein LOC122315550 [Carya illinoinensis]|uniref:uncharacterized protein LOC122315550 n=1 Tax=Carya illinoinensis TaxID=32201 RepID=UPI001C71DC94|nr:uncharacterized protein LOC122315550 [Carya illinoinensis]